MEEMYMTHENIKHSVFAALPPQCQTPACLSARAALPAARNAVITACQNLDIEKDKLSALRMQEMISWGIVAALLAVAAALSAIPIIGHILALVVLGLAALLAIPAGIATIQRLAQQGKVNDAEQALADARKNFDQAVQDIIKTCPDNCYS